MAIAGKPIYAGDVNTLAQLDLQRSIAQSKATQEGIAGASRGVGNLLSQKQQEQYGKLKGRELDIQEGQQEREDKERMERYTFESAQRAAQEGLLDADQLENIAPSFKDPTRQAIIKEEANRLRGLEETMDEEGPQIANRLNQFTGYEQRTLQRAREDLAKAEQGWKVPGVGWGPGSQANIEDAQNRVAMAEAAIAAKEAQIYEAYPQYANRLQLGEGGYTYLPRSGKRRGMGSQADVLPPAGGAAQGIMVAPQEPVVGADILPEDQGYAPPTGQPSAMAPDVLPAAEFPRSARGTTMPRSAPPTGPVAGRGSRRAIGPILGTPTGRNPRGAYRPSAVQQVQPTTETATTPSQETPSQGLLPANISDRLDQETLNEFYSRMAQFQRQGMSLDEARRRAGLWLKQQIDAEVF